MLIRTMGVQDLPRVMEIESLAYSTPWTEPTFRSLLVRRDVDLLVAEADERSAEPRVIGHAVFWVVVDQGELGNIAVAPECRRHGVGTRLLEAVLDCAEERGVREVFLEVRASNIGAQQLYAAHGFRETSRRRSYYTRPVEDALVLRRSS